MAGAVRLGDILIKAGLITPERLQDALKKQQRDKGEFLGQTLIRLGVVREDQIVQALSQQLLIPFFSMAEFVNEVPRPTGQEETHDEDNDCSHHLKTVIDPEINDRSNELLGGGHLFFHNR